MKKSFYPNSECLKYVEEAVLELEIVSKYPTRVLENSPFLKYYAVLEKGQCDDFLSICVESPDKLRNFIPLQIVVTGPIIMNSYYKRIQLNREKKVLYDRCNLALLEIKTQIKTERAKDRKELLDLSRILAERIMYELKNDLLYK